MGQIRRPAHPWNRGRRDWVEGNRDGLFSTVHATYITGWDKRLGKEEQRGGERGVGEGRGIKGRRWE